MVTIRLTYNPTWYNRVIKFATWYPYTHVDLCLNDSRDMFVSSLPGTGVCIHFEKAYKYEFRQIDVPFEPVRDFMLSQLGKKYDWCGIIGFGLRRNWQEDDKWNCSEILATAINKQRIIFDEAAYKITPRDIGIVSTKII